MCAMYHLMWLMDIHHAGFYCALGDSKTSNAIVLCCMLSTLSICHVLSKYETKAQVSALHYFRFIWLPIVTMTVCII